jgi:7-cyano-7-deazaguanine synthase
MSKAVVLLSGGVDSATELALALQQNDTAIALTCYYGQKHSIEIQCAANIARHYNVEHRIVEVPRIFGGAGSTLIDDGLDQPHLTYEEIGEEEGPSPTVVPFRNANLIAIATTVAVVENAQFVYVAAHAEDAHNWAYPDCTPEFLGAMSNAIYVGTYGEVRLKFPFCWMKKADSVALGLELGVPYELTYSCYAGNPFSCGQCPTCIERIEAFKSNSLIDPIEYEIGVEWEGCDEYYQK